MYSRLGEATLKSGAPMEIGVIECPDPQWAAQIGPLLGHKGQPWQFHVAAALQTPLDGLETRFYVGTVEGRAICNVMIVGARPGGPQQETGNETGHETGPGTREGVGILGHVYTAPEHRRQGAFSQLMAAQMAHARGLGYRVLTLGTGFESPPFWIYHAFGFRSIDGVSGHMKWLATPDAEANWFRPGATTVRPLRWDDWGPLDLVAFHLTEPDEELPRSWAFRLPNGHGSIEGSFLEVRRTMPLRSPGALGELREAIESRAYGARAAQGAHSIALTLESEHRAAAGWAILQPDELTLRNGWRLDFYVHPAFRASTVQLLTALPAPKGRTIAAYTSNPAGYRAAALEAAGFQRISTLPDWLQRGGLIAQPERLFVYARRS